MSEKEFGAMESASTITEAVQNQNVHELYMLVDKGGYDLNKRDKMGRTVLFFAACRGNSEITRILLENGADARIVDRNGNTPLHWSGHCEIIDLIVSYGGDVFARNKAGLLPRHMAARRGVSKDVIQFFQRLEKSRNEEKKESLSVIVTSFKEIHEELGPRYTILFILGLLFIVLYITITITGISRHFETRNPIIVETQSIKL
ncbi:ankyrin repeat domain-containing protein 46-like [Saccostrea echinata]|uniref:ankyrin repeat domain-containing protein 46-like n=1 Tax=Saccostrea echinata TaxID=191078 RepID=UPI002A83C99D|nr:ankyrin repeat domain-containing protein 46-like [Saccostrea echinata]